MVNPLPNDRIPEPKNRRNAVADISLPNTPVMHDNNKEEMDYQLPVIQKELQVLQKV